MQQDSRDATSISRVLNLSDDFNNLDLINRSIVAGFAGAVFGIVISISVNTALIDLIASQYFGLYFGFLLIITGVVILQRVKSIQLQVTDDKTTSCIKYLSILVIMSGIFCLFTSRTWFINTPKIFRSLIFFFIGTSFAFSLVFACVDVINLLVGAFSASTRRSFISTKNHIFIVGMIAMLMGGIFGVIFTFFDTEGKSHPQLVLAKMRNNHYCYPIGGFLGALGGAFLEFSRYQSDRAWQSLQINFDDNI